MNKNALETNTESCNNKNNIINQDTEKHSFYEISIEILFQNLKSKNNQIIYETIKKIKNLIIGNNKFKSIFLKEDLIKFLIELVNDNYINQIQTNDFNFDDNQIDLINQIILIFASFCLGNLEHVTRLISLYNIQELIYYILRINCDKITINSNKNNIKLTESCLGCLSNLYISAQMIPYLIFKLDRYLYQIDQYTEKLMNIDTLIKLFSISNFSKEKILNIISISSQVLSTIIFTEEFQTKENFLRNDIQQIIDNRRNLLIKSDIIKIFSILLINLKPAIQLNALKFYASISFESHESARSILSTTLANTNLIDLISAYLSRENCSELQLYSAKCLTNICRTCSLGLDLKKSSIKNNLDTPRNNNMLNYNDYSSAENSMDFSQVNFENLDRQLNIKLQPQHQDENLLPKDENNSKSIGFNSQLIKQKTLPTLVRLCCTYSINYRTNNYNNLNTFQSNPSLNKSLNILLLIESISTLTYLIELNADLQQTGSYLEQIIPTLSFNILSAYSSGVDLKTIDSNLNVLDADNNINIKLNKVKKRKHKLLKISSISSFELKKKSKTSESLTSDSTKSQLFLNASGSSKSESSLYSHFYLSYNRFVTKGIHFILNEHQYRFKNQNHISNLNIKNTEKTKYEKLETIILNDLSSFTNDLDKNMHKRVVCVCFHALAALASNNEEARRSISENLDLMSKLIESIRVKIQDDNENNFNQKIRFDYNLKKVEPSYIDEEDEDEEDDNEQEDVEDEDDDFEIGNQVVNSNFEQDYENDIKMNFEGDDQEINNDINELIAFDDVDMNYFNLYLSSKQSLNPNNDINYNLLIRSDSNLMRTSALCLIHSLSRSVQQLRTKFLENHLWMSILDLVNRIRIRKLKRIEISKSNGNDSKLSLINYSELKNTMDIGESNQVNNRSANSSNKKINTIFYDYEGNLNEQNFTSLILAIVANLLLDFSPCKENLIENDIIAILTDFVDSKNTSIKINAIWALMNLAYKSTQKVKQQILSYLTIEKIFQLLTEENEILVIKTLELIRNLLFNRTHIDQIMNIYGSKIIQAIIMILESEYYNIDIKEQALCILANIADGIISKEFIMGNEDLLRKINSFMTNSYCELQVAAVSCISNLVNSNDDGSLERQFKLKELGAHRILQKLLHSNDPVLFDRVKNALQQFSSHNLISTISNSVNVLSTSASNSSSSSSSA